MTDNGAGDHFALSQEDVERFDRDGYIGPVQIYEPEEMDELWRTVRRQLVDRSRAIYSAETRSSATNINPGIVDRVASILGPPIHRPPNRALRGQPLESS